MLMEIYWNGKMDQVITSQILMILSESKKHLIYYKNFLEVQSLTIYLKINNITMKEKYTIIDVLKYSFSIMDNIETPLWSLDYSTKWLKIIGWLYWIDEEKEQMKKSWEIDSVSRKKRNELSDIDYLDFLKQSDIYIYAELYNTPNSYRFPRKEPIDNYCWVIWFHEYRTNTKEQLDFAIEKITACLEWSKKKNEETNWGMSEWVEKNQKHLDKLLEMSI